MENKDSTQEKTIYIGITGDIIHPGIINIIQKASTYGRVIVGLLTESAIVEHKRLPYLNYEQRKKVIENIKGVSEVIPQKEWSYLPNLKKLRPNYIIHGDDWKTNYLQKIRAEVFAFMNEIGGEVIEIPYTQGIDSDNLLKNALSIGTTPDIRLKSLRVLTESKPIIRILEAHSCLSALIIENISVEVGDEVNRFDGIWNSSIIDSTSKGKPNLGLSNRMQTLTEILESTTKPIIYDEDKVITSSYLNYTINILESNGISAIVIRDQISRKYGTIYEEKDFCDIIREGKKAQITQDFMIIARIEEMLYGKSVDDALKKAIKCVMSGADVILIESKDNTANDIKEFCEKFRKDYPKIPIAVITSNFREKKEEEMAKWGVNIFIYENQMLRSSYPAMKKCAEIILDNQRSLEANQLCMPIKEILTLIPGTS
jgi:phosphoenolpyruvate phosphomutase